MSTLNSSQLYVKRSSTRLHAPPGGHSSLSFGSGGFGTTDASLADTKSAYSDPAEPLPPSSAGSFRGSGSGNGTYGVYNHPANNQSTDGNYGATPVAFHAMKGYAPVQGPAVGSHAYAGPVGGSGHPTPAPGALPFPGHASDASRPTSMQSNLSWGERGMQPPLTSSKRDQNWEKKRRLWLARKHGGSGSATPPSVPVTPYSQLPPPPASSYAGPGGYYEPAAYNPPSPLTKFMAQQSRSQPFTPQTQSNGVYDQPVPPSSYGMRPPSASGEYAPPPRTALQGYREDMLGTAYSSGNNHSSLGLRQGLTSSAGGYFPPANATGGAGGYGNGGLASGGQPPPRTSMPGTAFSTASTSSSNSTSRRQAPGGNSNWNPYS